MYDKIKTASDILTQTAATLYDVRHNPTEAAVIAAYDNIKEAKEYLDAALSVSADKVPVFSESDYLRTDKPYAYLYGLSGEISALRWAQIKAELAREADLYGVGDFNALYHAYELDMETERGKLRKTDAERFYARLCDWVSANADKMRGMGEESGEPCYGLIENGRERNGMKYQESNEIEARLAKALIAFVERATKEGAYPHEVEALPGVAETLRRVLD